jgi:hypothetical protein
MGDPSKIKRTHGDYRKIGEKIGLTKFQVCRILNGKSSTSLEKGEVIAEFFGATLNDLAAYRRQQSSSTTA